MFHERDESLESPLHVGTRLYNVFAIAAVEGPGSLDVGEELTLEVYDERGDSKHTTLGEVSFTVKGDVTVTLRIQTPDSQEARTFTVSVSRLQ